MTTVNTVQKRCDKYYSYTLRKIVILKTFHVIMQKLYI